MPINRRDFLKGMGFTAGGIALTSTAYRHLIPYIHQPDDIIPGVSTWYATACRECPAGCAMIVRNRESRSVKCEGNPLSPLNHGKLCARGQAALHGLYDPDRIKGPMRRDEHGKLVAANWDGALAAVGKKLADSKRVAVMTDLQTGSLDALMREWLAAFGSTRLVVYEPIDYQAIKNVCGGVVPSFDIAKSDFLISFAADFLETWISPVEFAGDFAAMRQVRDGKRGGFAYVGPRTSMTAVSADYRLIIPPGQSQAVALAILSAAGKVVPSGFSADEVCRKYGFDRKVIAEIGRALADSKSPLALPGLDTDSTNAAAHMNSVLNSTLVNNARPHTLTGTSSRTEVSALIKDMELGRVDALVIHGANPVYSLPESARFAEALKRVPLVVSLSSFMDETTTNSHWILPSNTPLESWGDYEPYPGVSNLMQPTMGLLFDTRHTGDILMGLATSAGHDAMKTFKAGNFLEYLRLKWGFPAAVGETSLPSDWEGLMQRGGKWSAKSASGSPTQFGISNLDVQVSDDIRLLTFPHIYLYDGRGANRRWLQEMPEPITKAAWDSWAEIHPSTASKLGVKTDDVIEIQTNGSDMEISTYVTDGVAPGVVAVPMGQGHTEYGQFAKDLGANVLPLMESDSPVIEVRATGKRKWVTRVKGSVDQHDRDIVKTVQLSKPIKRDVPIIMPLPLGYKQSDFYPGHAYKKHRWAMTVDLDRCIGCHSCVAACYAENNIGVVGPDGYWRRREMSWIRIDRYIDWKNPEAPVLFQPMLCQQCDSAPCEPVCPVYASSHNEEGLNAQIYNRCIGTRYCSHNCPYKVRRFNFFDYKWPSPLHYQLNPDVTVRCRGVMEKCTFCIQRIREAEIVADREERRLTDGEITPACAQTCPTGAFTFGDLMDPNSRVSKIVKDDPRAYQVLAELNTKPAVIYLKRIV